MGFLRDSDANRVQEMLRRERSADPLLAQWTQRLLEDRRARTALIQRLARQLHHLRQRLQQAARYLDGLMRTAYDESRSPWADKLPCPHCGAPADQVASDYRPGGGHVIVHRHVDGVSCERPPDSQAPAARPKP